MKKPVKQGGWRLRTGSDRSGRLTRPAGYAASASSWFIGRLAVLGVALACLLALVVLGGLLVWQQLGQSAFFQITAIRIDGCVRITQKQVLALSGVDVHSNLLALSPRRIRTKIEAHDWIESATVSRKWPNRLQITVRERQPLALLSLPEGLYYTDHFAKPFARALPGDLDFPVITGLSSWDGLPNRQRQAVKQALNLIRLADRGGVVLPAQGISEINIDADGAMIMFLVSRPFPIYLGKSPAVSLNYHRLVRVLSQLHRERAFTETSAIRMDYLPDRVLVER
ncbi:MAG: FtsQ-type POTRA domain-containing protein [Desulfobulbaceae bacterium]|nr:MAG: FtsQ-type POTRA domain-containing protein [Desulfobulbaceae bacterium]